tara:strand:+ start:383 stop:970 length:588 start_codon:yes stop_codon:yes gene_type:complete
LLPELHSLIHGEPDALQEETELQPSEMLQVVLVFERGEKRLHTWRETLSLVIIKVRQSDLITVLGSGNLLEIEINGVVIGQVDQELGESRILQDGGQVLVSPHELSHEFGSELRSSDLVQIRDVHESDTFVHEHLSVVHQVQRIFERHFYEFFSLEPGSVWQDLRIETYLLLEFNPILVPIGELLVVHVAFLSQD